MLLSSSGETLTAGGALTRLVASPTAGIYNVGRLYLQDSRNPFLSG